MNNKTIIEFDVLMMWRILQILEPVIKLGASVGNILLYLQNGAHYTKEKIFQHPLMLGKEYCGMPVITN